MGYWILSKHSIAKCLRPEESIDSDPASGWTTNLPCEGAGKSDPVPGRAFGHLGGIMITCKLDNFLRDAHICIVERHPFPASILGAIVGQ